jgi:protein phosphatase
MITVESAAMTHVGLLRKRNEDCHLCSESLQLYVVADGLGGHQAGDIASQMVVEQLRIVLESTDTQKRQRLHRDESLSPEANLLVEAIKSANASIFGESQRHARFRGMASTVSALFLTGQTMIAANVGDSPIYLLRQNTIEMLSRPHNLMAEQQALTSQYGGVPPKSLGHILTKAVGIEADVEPDVSEIQCFPDDKIIICSDGLSNKVEMKEILRTVSENPPGPACRLLVDSANQRGGDDNITVIVVWLKKILTEKRGFFGTIKAFLGF